MGNYRSGRWNFHTARQTTGASRRIYPKNIRPAIAFAEKGSLARWSFSWNRGGEPCGSISYQVEIKNDLYFLRLIYTVTLAGKEPEPLDYSIPLTTTPTPWGALRWWFTCPAAGCGRRVGALYLPPGARRFACRHCHNLTYQACLDSHKYDTLYKRYPALEALDLLRR